MLMRLTAIKDYFGLYIKNVLGFVSVEFYIELLAILCLVALLSISLYGMKKGSYYILLSLLIEVVVLIYCFTVLFRASADDYRYNLVPFWSYTLESTDLQNSLFVEHALNVLMFVPFGFLLGCTFKGIGWKKVLLSALCISVSIETLQFVLRRGFVEFDDLMHNVLGAVMGFGVFLIIKKIYEGVGKRNVRV